MNKAILALAMALAGCSAPDPALATPANPLFAAEAVRQGVPVGLALAVINVESRGNCNAVGPATHSGRGQGPLQIMPSSARALGYRGPAAHLATCGEGLRYGMKHLAMCYRLAGTIDGAARCHVGGAGALHSRSKYVRGYVASVQKGL